MRVDEEKILCQASKLVGQDVASLKLVYQKNYIVIDDATKKAMVCVNKKPVAFVLISAENYPDTLLKNHRKTIGILNRLGDKNAKRVLVADLVDASNGVSYSITKYHARVSASYGLRFIQKRVLGILIIRWLINTVKFSRRAANADEVNEYFIQPLKLFVESSILNVELESIARSAIKDIESGLWQPLFTPAHNDLWSGNVLLKGFFDFVIIDWGGSAEDGYPFYDFIRVSDSFQLHKRISRWLLREYCREILCADVEQIKYYLLANFAVQRLNLGSWSEAHCLSTLDQCIKFIDGITA